ncbi:MAG TPA: 2TM domain-containing protein [Kangiella sp.]
MIIFAVIGGIPVVAGLIINPENFWIILPLIGWAIGVLIHGLNVFESVNIFGPK